MSYEKERGGGGGRGVVIFADGIIARQRGEANRQMDSGSGDSSFFFLVRTDNIHCTGQGP